MEFVSATTEPAGGDGWPRIEQETRRNLSENYDVFWRYLRARVRTADDANDVLQDYCLRVLGRSHQIQSPEAVGSWMAQVLRTTLVDYYRRAAAENRCAECLSTAVSLPKHESDEPACPFLRTAMQTIKPEDADIIARIDVLGEPRGEIAKGLRTSVNALTVRLFRARAALRKKLGGFCQNECDRYGTTCSFAKVKGPLSEAGGTRNQARAVAAV
jgi:RNA polymerase sigma-70 factor (ECF subfamily)